MSGISYMTQGGYDKANGELEHMKTIGRAEASMDLSLIHISEPTRPY